MRNNMNKKQVIWLLFWIILFALVLSHYGISYKVIKFLMFVFFYFCSLGLLLVFILIYMILGD